MYIKGVIKVATLFNNLTSTKTRLHDKGVDLTLIEFIQLMNASIDFKNVSAIYRNKYLGHGWVNLYFRTDISCV